MLIFNKLLLIISFDLIKGPKILNIQENLPVDDYSENVINNPEPIIKMFKNSTLILNRKIKNIFDTMN